MGIFRSLDGRIQLELTSADLTAALLKIVESGIRMDQINHVDDLTIRFWLPRRCWRKVKKLADQRGDNLKIVRREGLFWTVERLVRRPVLVSGLLLLVILTIYGPERIFFVRVEGNLRVPSALILEKAGECGIHFGASRRLVRSEKMKNELLAAIPELKWAGINTKGCVAVISVTEKTQGEGSALEPSVSRIVASCDAVIVSATAEQGNLICRTGQAVKKGELLVSGYTDCGLAIRATRAVAEIYGQTSRGLTVVCPADRSLRGRETGRQTKYGLIIGKKRINFYKDSGILGGTCGKMSTVNYMTLPGGFVLPVAVVAEQSVWYQTEICSLSESAAEDLLCKFADDYLQQQMLAGRVLVRDQNYVFDNETFCLYGRYACLEMIGREQSEEYLENYGKID